MSLPGRLVGLAVFGTVLVGCYTLRPLRGAEPELGTRVAFDVNDTGRVALGGTMGPQIAQVEGQLIDKDSAGYLLAVSSIRLLQGGEQVWSGEQVRVDSRYVGTAYGRRFSLGRTIGLGVVGAGGIAAFVATLSLITSGSDPFPRPGDSVDVRFGRP